MTPARPGRPAIRSAPVLIAVALVLVGCGSPSNPSVSTAEVSVSAAASSAAAAVQPATLSKTLVFSPPSSAAPALKSLAEGIKTSARSQGWDVVVQDPRSDPQKQNQLLDQVITSGRAGAIWVIAVAPATLRPMIAKAQSKGIPLLVNGTPQEYGFDGPQPGVSFNAIDYQAEGTSLGTEMGKCVAAKMGGRAKILFAQNQSGQAGIKEVTSAMNTALKAEAPNAGIVSTVVSKDRYQAESDIAAALQAHPESNALLAANDEGMIGGLAAFAAAGKQLVCSVDVGGNGQVLRLVKEGLATATVALQTDADLKQCFETLIKMQDDPTAKGPMLTVPQKVIVTP